MQLGLTLRSHA